MKRINNIVVSDTEPSVNSLWISQHAIRWFGKSGWEGLDFTDNTQLWNAINQEIADRQKEDNNIRRAALSNVTVTLGGASTSNGYNINYNVAKRNISGSAWTTNANLEIFNATSLANGIMSSSDKAKLDSIDATTLVNTEDGLIPSRYLPSLDNSYLPLAGGTLTGNITFGSTPVGNVGDAVLYDKQADKLVIVPTTDDIGTEYPSDNYEPIGVVVIPASHNVYGTGECGVMSLKEMSTYSPDTGNDREDTTVSIAWGTNDNISSLNTFSRVACVGNTTSPAPEIQSAYNINSLYSVTGNYDHIYIYLPSDMYVDATPPYLYKKCPNDSNSLYPEGNSAGFRAAPSPYVSDGSRNPGYYQITSPSSSDNALADFDGRGNTDKIIAQRGSKDYSSWLPNNNLKGDYPAASCCDMFHTSGTQQGNWYLPAMGELGYIVSRTKQINDSISKLKTLYGGDTAQLLPDYTTDSYSVCFWSSTQYRTNSVYFINNKLSAIGADYKNSSNKVNRHNRVRAFLRVLPTSNSKGIIISGKSESDLLNAAGSTTPISDIITQVQAAIVDSAPETLDTLNELATALGNDSNFAATIATQIAQKANKTVATESVNGLMSAEDKVKLGAISSTASTPITLTADNDISQYKAISQGIFKWEYSSIPVGVPDETTAEGFLISIHFMTSHVLFCILPQSVNGGIYIRVLQQNGSHGEWRLL